MSYEAKANFSVGQKLFWVHKLSRDRCGIVTIEKIGNKWIYLSNLERIDCEDLISPRGFGRCYLSENEYRDEIELSSEWQKIRQWLSEHGRVPEGMTVAKIAEIENIVDPKEPQ